MNNPEENINHHSPKKSARQPAAVYRRRRLVAGFLFLCGVAASTAVIVAATGFFLNGDTEPEGTVAEASAAPESEENGDGTQQALTHGCDTEKVVITPHSDAKTYPNGQNPRFSVAIENKNSVECDINLGTKTMNYSIRQGGNEVFSSQHCASGELTDWPRRLAPQVVVEVEDFTWQRTFTRKGCPESSTKPNQALSGNYSLTVRIGSYGSGQLDFALK